MGVSKKDTVIACSRCILDSTDDANLILDEQGVCNHCHYYDSQKTLLVREGQEASALLEKTLAEIKQYGKNKPYDCLIGLSGGVDSSYVAYLAKQFELRPLCIHSDALFPCIASHCSLLLDASSLLHPEVDGDLQSEP